jgi:hypothetical protein
MTLYDDIAADVKKLIVDEWIAQGHNMTGEFAAKLTHEVRYVGKVVEVDIIDGTARGYGKILEYGVKPQQIRYPYARARIEGLVRFVGGRGIASGKLALSIAYAIATTHKREGMPTAASVRFSKTGKRTEYVKDVEKDFFEVVARKMGDAIAAAGRRR